MLEYKEYLFRFVLEILFKWNISFFMIYKFRIGVMRIQCTLMAGDAIKTVYIGYAIQNYVRAVKSKRRAIDVYVSYVWSRCVIYKNFVWFVGVSCVGCVWRLYEKLCFVQNTAEEVIVMHSVLIGGYGCRRWSGRAIQKSVLKKSEYAMCSGVGCALSCYLIYCVIRGGSVSHLCKVQNVIYSTIYELYRHTPERQAVKGLLSLLTKINQWVWTFFLVTH